MHVFLTHKVLIAKKKVNICGFTLKINVLPEQSEFDYHYELVEALITSKSLHTLLTFGKWLEPLCC